MNLQSIIERLSTVSEFKQIAEAGNASTLPQIDTEALLTSVINPVVADNIYALKLPETPIYPNIVHMLVGGSPRYFEKNILTQVDTFIISLRAETIEQLTVTAKLLFIAIIESEFAIEITDKQKEFDDKRECYRLDLELSFTVPATGINAETPAIIIYETGRDASESDYDNFIKQRVNCGYGITILTTENNIDELRNLIQAKLLGFQQTPEHYEMQFARGSPLENEGGLSIWRDIYQDSYSIQQTA